MKSRIHFPNSLHQHTLPTKYLYKEPLSKSTSLIIRSLTISLDFLTYHKIQLYIKRIALVHHLTIRINTQISEFKRYFVKKSSIFQRIAQIPAFSVTLEVPFPIISAYMEFERYFKNCKHFEIHQYDPTHNQSASFERFGHGRSLEKVAINSFFLKPKLQADSLRIIPMLKKVQHLDISLNMSYENLPAGDCNTLRNTIGKVEGLKVLDLTNIATSQVQASTHLSDIVATLNQLKELESLSMRVYLWDFETNIITKLTSTIQNLKELKALDLRVNILNKQFSNRAPQTDISILPNLKTLKASANSLPEEKLVQTILTNCQTLKSLDLSVSISSRDGYRALLASIKANPGLESLVLRYKLNVAIPAIQELADIISESKALKDIQVYLQGKGFPLDQGLKRLVNVSKEFEGLESFVFEAAKEFEISGRGLEEVFEGLGRLETVKRLRLGVKVFEKVENREMFRDCIMRMKALRKCYINVMGMRLGGEISEMIESIKEEHKEIRKLEIVSLKTYV